MRSMEFDEFDFALDAMVELGIDGQRSADLFDVLTEYGFDGWYNALNPNELERYLDFVERFRREMRGIWGDTAS